MKWQNVTPPRQIILLQLFCLSPIAGGAGLKVQDNKSAVWGMGLTLLPEEAG